jgi:hypothetical protein
MFEMLLCFLDYVVCVLFIGNKSLNKIRLSVFCISIKINHCTEDGWSVLIKDPSDVISRLTVAGLLTEYLELFWDETHNCCFYRC